MNPAAISIDFKGLVACLKGPVFRTIASGKMYAGVLRGLLAWPGWKNFEQIRWCKAHMNADEFSPLSPGWFAAAGNNHADSWAKRGAELHGPAEQVGAHVWATRADEMMLAIARAGAAAMLALLAAPRRAPRTRHRPAPKPKPPAFPDSPHYWLAAGKGC